MDTAQIYRSLPYIGVLKPEVQQRFTEFGGTAVSTNPDEMGKFVEGEITKWARIVTTRKIEVQ